MPSRAIVRLSSKLTPPVAHISRGPRPAVPLAALHTTTAFTSHLDFQPSIPFDRALLAGKVSCEVQASWPATDYEGDDRFAIWELRPLTRHSYGVLTLNWCSLPRASLVSTTNLSSRLQGSLARLFGLYGQLLPTRSAARLLVSRFNLSGPSALSAVEPLDDS